MNLVAVNRGLKRFVFICDELGIVQQEDVGEGGAEEGSVNIYVSQRNRKPTLEFGRGEVYLFAAGAKQLHSAGAGSVGEADGKQVLVIAIDPRTRSVGAPLVLLILHITLTCGHHHSLNSRRGENEASVDHPVHVVRCVFQLRFINLRYP